MKKTLLAFAAMVSLCGYAQLPMEGFESPWEGSPAAPPGWTVVNEFGPAVTWQKSNPDNMFQLGYEGMYSAYLGRENAASSESIPKDWLISPAFAVQSNAVLKFYSKLSIAQDQGSVYKVYIGTDPTDLTTFTEIYSAIELEINSNQTNYELKSITIPATYEGQQMHIAFVMIGDNADRWLIDNVSVSTICESPTNLMASNITNTEATLGWTQEGLVAGWEIEVVDATAIPSGIGTVVTVNPVIVSETTAGEAFTLNGAYKYYVRSLCGDGGVSEWVGPLYFPNDSCPAPTDLVITAIDINNITYAWTGTDATSYDYFLTSANDVIPTASTTPTGIVNSPTVTISGIVPGVEYKLYVRSRCGSQSFSIWVGMNEDEEPSVNNNVFSGTVIYDTDGDGICDENAAGIPYVEVQITLNGQGLYSVFTNEEGKYSLNGLQDGVNNLSLQVIAPQVFTAVAPLIQEVTFSDENFEIEVVHCLAQPSVGNDLSVTMIPLGPARPGLNTTYRIVAQNAGSTVLENVLLTVSFDDDRIDYVSSEYDDATATQGSIAINLGTMQPFSVNNGDITFNTLAPPVNMGEENLHFDASISDFDDITVDNNTSVLNQTIVNSYDPNDITVHEGAEIYEEQADDYLTYTIRFQNTGTAEAIDIKLTNTLDALLDWSTLKPLQSSHSYTVKRTDDLVEFDYKNIHLADSTSNEAASHGYVTYKIKPKAEFGIGDEISNKAEIYFDFNPVIETNTAKTKVIALAGLKDNAFAFAKLYPNPTKDQLHVEVAKGELQSVTVHDSNGRLCLSANAGVIDVSPLSGGMYFVKITTDLGSADYKIIKK